MNKIRVDESQPFYYINFYNKPKDIFMHINQSVTLFGHQFPLVDEATQKDPKYTLYLYWAEKDGVIYVKFGESFHMGSVWNRYSTITGAIQNTQMLYVWESKIGDKVIHKFLKEKYNWDNTEELNTNEAYIVKSAQEIKDIIADITYHVTTDGKDIKAKINELYKEKFFKTKFTCRQEQQDFVDKFLTYINASNRKARRFLLHAVCRFGKTATTLYTIIEKLHLKRILVLTSKCDTEFAWKNDYKKWSFSKDYIFVTKTVIQAAPELLKNENLIAWCSLQSSAKDYETFDEDGNEIIYDAEDEPWQKSICDADWDIVIVDECHYGVDTPRSQGMIEELLKKNPIFLEISATPFKKILNKEYTNENTYAYTLIDEYAMYHNDPNYIPVKLFHLDLMKHAELYLSKIYSGPIVKKQLMEHIKNTYDEEGKFGWGAYFTQFESAIIGLEFDLLYNKHFKVTGPHCMVFVNRIAYGNKLEIGLDKSKYNVINICGDNKITQDYINEQMETSEKPVIIISCGKYMTGSTLDRLTNVIFMGTINSPEMYLQYGLRAKNKFEGRNGCPCSIYDLNQKSFLKTDAFKGLITVESLLKEKTKGEILKSYEKAFWMLEWNDADIFETVEHFAEDFTKIFSTFNSDSEMPDCSFLDDSIISIAEKISDINIKDFKSTFKITSEQCDSAKELKDESNPIIEQPIRKSDKTQKILAELRAKFRQYIAYIPSFMKCHDINNIEEIWNDKNIVNFKYWSTFDSRAMQILKENVSVFHWNQLLENIINIKNNLPEDELQWKYRGKLPDWF